MKASSYNSPHEQRQAVLDAMAVLCGYTLGALKQFPDGARPDVLRIHPSNGGAFLGDAKDTETPGNLSTQARLTSYFGWAKSIQKTGKPVVFALCVRSGLRTSKRWLDLLNQIGLELGLARMGSGIRRISSECTVVWMSTKPR